MASASLTASPMTAPFRGFPEEEDTSPRADLAATYVTFDLGAQTLATDVRDVREILDMQLVAPLPNAGMELLGMIDVRGEGLAVLDLQGKLGLSADPESPDRRIIILEIGSETRAPIGIIADRVRNVIEIPPERIEPAPAALGTWDASVLEGVARLEGRLVFVLCFSKLLAGDMRGPFDFG